MGGVIFIIFKYCGGVAVRSNFVPSNLNDFKVIRNDVQNSVVFVIRANMHKGGDGAECHCREDGSAAGALQHQK